jgi:thioesterase domain-containing protein
MPLQPAGKRLPIFGVPGHNGDVFCYMPLVRELGSEQPFYGLQPPGTDGKRPPLTDVKELAAYFVNDIRTLQPKGPYLLSGYCLGGFTAFEIAQQLRRAGQEVALVALFGTQSPAAMRLSHRAWVEVHWRGRRVVEGVKKLWGMSFQEIQEYLQAKRKQQQWEQEQEDIRLLHNPYRPRVEQATVTAVRRYQPEMYPGRLSLFLPNPRQISVRYGRALEWRDWTSSYCDYEFGPSGCTNDTMLREPYAKVFADLLRAHLYRIQERKGGGFLDKTESEKFPFAENAKVAELALLLCMLGNVLGKL